MTACKTSDLHFLIASLSIARSRLGITPTINHYACIPASPTKKYKSSILILPLTRSARLVQRALVLFAKHG
jgi:hypothetical protein